MNQMLENKSLQVNTEPCRGEVKPENEVKRSLLLSFEDKWGDDLKVVLSEQDIRELFSDLANLMAGKSVKEYSSVPGCT